MRKKLFIVAATLILMLSIGVAAHAGGGNPPHNPPDGWSITLPPSDCGYCGICDYCGI